MKELKVKEAETEYFIVAPKTASQLGISEEDILLVKNPINQKTVAGKAKIDEGIEGKTLLINSKLLNSIGLDEDSQVKVSNYGKKIKKPVEAEFEVEMRGDLDQDTLKLVEENEEEFIEFINDRIWTRDSKFLWKDKKLLISLKETDLEIEKDDVVDFAALDSYSLSSSPTDFYSGVLLIDLSGSMETKDLPMEGIVNVFEKIYTNIESKITKKFLKKLKEEPKIKRSQGATLSSLIYLFYEIEKEAENKISVILFSEEASVILFEDQKYFSTKVCDVDRAFEKVIENIRYHPRGRTDISTGLKKAIETMKDFEHEKMKMLVLLTDGEPHPDSLDDRETVMDVVDDRLAPRRDVIINTIGLGDEVDHHLLDKIANKTGGEYTYVNTLESLTEAFSKYADSISADDLYP